MKVSYEFISGDARVGKEVVEVEVDEKMGAVIMELDRREFNSNRKETRRHTSYSDDNDKISTLADETDVECEVIYGIQRKKEIKQLYYAIEKLNSKQKNLIKSIYFENISVSDYASREGVTQSAISQRLNTAIKKLRKFF